MHVQYVVKKSDGVFSGYGQAGRVGRIVFPAQPFQMRVDAYAAFETPSCSKIPRDARPIFQPPILHVEWQITSAQPVIWPTAYVQPVSAYFLKTTTLSPLKS